MNEREQTTLRLSNELCGELERIAEQSGLTVTALLIIAIWQSVLRHRCKER